MDEAAFVFNVFTSTSDTPSFQQFKSKRYHSTLTPNDATALDIHATLLAFYASNDDPVWKEESTYFRPGILVFARWPGGPKRHRTPISSNEDWEQFLAQFPSQGISRHEVDILLWMKKHLKRRVLISDDGTPSKYNKIIVQVVLREPVYFHEGKTRRASRELRSGKIVNGSKAPVLSIDYDEQRIIRDLSLGDFRVELLEHLHSGNDRSRDTLRHVDQENGGLYKACGGGTKMELVSDTRMLRQIVRSAPVLGCVKTLTFAFDSGVMTEDVMVTVCPDGETRFSQRDVSIPMAADVVDSNRKASADSKIAMSIAERVVQVIYEHNISPLQHGSHAKHAAFLVNFFNQHATRTVKYGAMLDAGDMVQLFDDIIFPDWEHRTAQKACGDGPLPARGKFPPQTGSQKLPGFVPEQQNKSLADSLATLVHLKTREIDLQSHEFIAKLHHIAKQAKNDNLLSSHDLRRMVHNLLHARNKVILTSLIKASTSTNDSHTNALRFVEEYQSMEELGFVFIAD